MRTKVLSEDLTLYFTAFFPYISSKKTHKRFRVIVGIGGNIGDTKARFKRLFFYFKKYNMVDIVETSPMLRNPPFGYLEQEDFYNAVMVLQTNMYPKIFLRFLLHVEKIFGRARAFANSPRTLDLDIVFFDTITLNSNELTVPHPEWETRASVVIPLSYLRYTI